MSYLGSKTYGTTAPKPPSVILSVAKNLILQHPNTSFLYAGGCYLGAIEKGNIRVEDEILRYAQNDRRGRVAHVPQARFSEGVRLLR